MEQEKNLLRISNTLNLTRQEFSLLEKHIFLLTLLNLKDRQGYDIEANKNVNIVVELNPQDLKETNRERVKEALEKITSRKIFFDNSKDNKDYFGYLVPFIYAKYEGVRGDKSSITVKLNADCTALFLELANGYTTTDLLAVLNFKSSFTIRLYELVSQYLNQEVWTVSIEKLYNLLGIEEDSTYRSYGRFKQRILDYSQEEIYQYCKIAFSYKPTKKGRKVTHLTFTIRNAEKQNRIDVLDEINATRNQIQQLSPLQIAQTYNMITQKYTLKTYQAEYIAQNTDMFNEFVRIDIIIENMIERGKPPKDRTKYLAKCLGLDKVKFPKKKTV